MSNRNREILKTKKLFCSVIKKILERPEQLTVSEYAEKYRILSDTSNVSGQWSNDITPYLVEIMDTFNDTDIRETYFCKASQVGGTEVLINMLCYIVSQAPAPTMMVYPIDELAKDISEKKLKPAFRLMPNVKRIFNEKNSKQLNLNFSNMDIRLQGANSPSKLASFEIKYLFFDEIDKLGGASKKEASPYNLAKERTKTYKSQSKIYACSTPTLKTNYIWNLCDNADEVKHYFVPCPHCGSYIELSWKQVIFDKNEDKTMSNYERAQTAIYVCQECGCGITDQQKPKMLRKGEWRAVKKRGIGKAKTVGYWINSLYSIFITWAYATEEFLKSKDDPDLLQNFVNSWLAEPWEDTKLRTSESLVTDRQTDIPELVVPDWAKLLTGGVDVQENCVYYTIRAWGDYITSQNIIHGQAFSFMEVEEVMNLQWEKENGERMVVSLCLIDSGYEADSTYSFCVDNLDWALPCKGSSNPMQNHYKIGEVNRVGSKTDGIPLVTVDGEKYKDMIAARMQRDNGIGSWMVYKDCDEEYAKQVTSEHKVNVKDGRGRKKLQWVQKYSHAPNHYLDTEVYAMAAADIRGVRTLHLQKIEEENVKELPPPEENWIKENEQWIMGGQ